jgi:hypothetical protein
VPGTGVVVACLNVAKVATALVVHIGATDNRIDALGLVAGGHTCGAIVTVPDPWLEGQAVRLITLDLDRQCVSVGTDIWWPVCA